jgi:dihydropteroate synthase
MASKLAIPTWKLADRTLTLDRPLCAGIVNVTTDSMWEGARSETPARAIEDGVRLIGEGFEMLDVGAVPARSGPPVSTDEEASALVPAIEGLAGGEIPVSADTFSAEVAARALAAGAVAINDIGGGSAEMFELIAEAGCGYVLMQIDGPPRVDRQPHRHADPIDHLQRWFTQRIEDALALGVRAEQIALDPGFDFDLGVEDGVEVLRRLGELHSLGRPLYLSLSRKDFLGALISGSWEDRAAPAGREWATAAAATLAVREGAQILRLHDASALQAVRVAAAVSGPGADGRR